MSLKMIDHSNFNVTQIGRLNRKWNVTKSLMSLKMGCHSKWNVTLNKMSLKLECHSK